MLKDAVGAIWGIGAEPLHEQGGYLWTLDLQTGQVDPGAHQLQRQDLYYTTTDCSGSAYITLPIPLPRVPFMLMIEHTYRVRQDGAMPVTLDLHSGTSGGGGGCSTMATPYHQTVFNLDQAPSIGLETPPTIGSTPPLHLERLN